MGLWVVWVMRVVVVLMVVSAAPVHAGSLGIPLDGFMATWQAWCIGLGIVFFATGGAIWFGEKINSPWQPALAGAMNLVVPAGIFGGILTIAGLLGLAVGGSTLPL